MNVIGTERVLDAATDAGVAVRADLDDGSGPVRARAPRRCRPAAARARLDERWPLMPTGNPYSDTKIAAEHLVLAAHAHRARRCRG